MVPSPGGGRGWGEVAAPQPPEEVAGRARRWGCHLAGVSTSADGRLQSIGEPTPGGEGSRARLGQGRRGSEQPLARSVSKMTAGDMRGRRQPGDTLDSGLTTRIESRGHRPAPGHAHCTVQRRGCPRQRRRVGGTGHRGVPWGHGGGPCHFH